MVFYYCGILITISYYFLPITFLMSLVLGILLAFIVFLVVVVVHEFGHFSTARLTKMRVEEFGFGIPPRVAKLWKDKK